MSVKIASMGFGFPGNPDKVKRLRFMSSQTLVDIEITIVNLALPIHRFDVSDLAEQIDPLLSHWKDEIERTCKHGNTVIALAQEFREHPIPFDTYRFSAYDLLPIKPTIHIKSGHDVVLSSRNRLLASYWKSFGEFTYQQIIIEDDKFSDILLETKVESKVVGAVYKIGNGHLFLLPPLSFHNSQYTDERGEWRENAIQAGQKLIKEFVSIHNSIRSQSEVTPPPEWTEDSQYVFKQETQLVGEIEQLEAQIEQIQGSISTQSDELQDLRQFKRLLFDQGHPLEDSILETLRILGFEATQYDDGSSEFDAIFESEEGRFLGEAEGRDDKPIAIKKIRQLITNLQEDYDRDEVDELAHSVLFGNAYRLSPVDERDDFFTDKCRDLATRNDVALVRTPDLFPIVQYLLDNDDDEYKQLCRESILNTNGEVVVFPPIPKTEGQST